MTEKKKKGRVTLQDIATTAGVSRTTVYAVLNEGKKITTGVSKALRVKIQETVHDLGYIPNNLARSLVSGKTRNVGVILANYRMMDDFADVFDKNGYMIFPLIHKKDPLHEKRCIELLISRGCDAIIIARTSPGNNTELLQRVMDHGIPLILLAEAHEGFPQARHVIFNEHRGMQLPVEFLAAHGVRRFALPTCNASYQADTRSRYAAAAIRKLPDSEIIEYPHCDDRRGVLKAAAAIRQLSPEKRPQAMISSGDLNAWLMIEALRVVGLRVPEDIRITGIGNDCARHHLITLTTVELSSLKMAEYCYQAFNDELNQCPGRLYVVEPQLIVRESAPAWL
ncbi:MAG: LacI family DNA-binding transcriptional regulator [Victivallales bacterium]